MTQLKTERTFKSKTKAEKHVCEYCGKEILRGEPYISRRKWTPTIRHVLSYQEGKKRKGRRYAHTRCFEEHGYVDCSAR